MSILSTLNKLTGKQDKNVLAALNSLTGKTADDIEEAIGNLSAGDGGGGEGEGLTRAINILYCFPENKDSSGIYKKPGSEELPDVLGDGDAEAGPVVPTERFFQLLETEYNPDAPWEFSPCSSKYAYLHTAGDAVWSVTAYEFQIPGGLTTFVMPSSAYFPNWRSWDEETDSIVLEVWTDPGMSLSDRELITCYEYTGYTVLGGTCYLHVPRTSDIEPHVPAGTDLENAFIRLCIYLHGGMSN